MSEQSLYDSLRRLLDDHEYDYSKAPSPAACAVCGEHQGFDSPDFWRLLACVTRVTNAQLVCEGCYLEARYLRERAHGTGP